MRAALLAIAEGGTAAVAVETLAARLGATKGSFYWHFRNREHLLERILDHWMDRATIQITRWARANQSADSVVRRAWRGWALFDTRAFSPTTPERGQPPVTGRTRTAPAARRSVSGRASST